MRMRGRNKPLHFPLVMLHTQRMSTEFSLAQDIVICFTNLSNVERNHRHSGKDSYGSEYVRPSPASVRWLGALFLPRCWKLSLRSNSAAPEVRWAGFRSRHGSSCSNVSCKECKLYVGNADFKSWLSKEHFSSHSEACANIKKERGSFFFSFFIVSM